MSKAFVTVACLTGLLVSTAHVAQAQYGGDVPREGACFYRDADCRGRSFCIQSGGQLSALPGGFDEVSSIRTYGRASA